MLRLWQAHGVHTTLVVLWIGVVLSSVVAGQHKPGEHAFGILHSKIPFHAIQVGSQDFEGELYEVCQKGLVSANITTNTFRHVRIELMPLVRYPIEVSINPGAILESPYSVYQPLVIAERKIMRLSATNQTVVLATHSLTFQKRIPVGQLTVTPLMMPYHGITDGPDKPVVSQTQLWRQTSGGGRKVQMNTNLKRLKNKNPTFIANVSTITSQSPILWDLLLSICLLCTPDIPRALFGKLSRKDQKDKKEKDKDADGDGAEGGTKASIINFLQVFGSVDRLVMVVICVAVVHNVCHKPVWYGLTVLYTLANVATEGGILVVWVLIPLAVLLCLFPWVTPLPKWLFYVIPQLVAGGCAMHAIGQPDPLTAGIVGTLLIFLLRLPSVIATVLSLPLAAMYWIGALATPPLLIINLIKEVCHTMIYPLYGSCLSMVILSSVQFLLPTPSVFDPWLSVGHVSVLDAFSVDPLKVTDVLGEATVQTLIGMAFNVYCGCLAVGCFMVFVRFVVAATSKADSHEKTD
eukprot:TRINITY_DN61630_c0_g1_i1.p1 TRINITY_DN61630_c0_g1~~TRINITY_DN61630_c0_g1_i1.p1  ORF type:complete len:520 (+),score=-9.09 TRINITY_DN61630_c0_g1_i1:16-1575(+)